ncbi:hypothetical protein BH695_2924 [Microcystis aeruginosa PCC 7806SL]|uniref:Uncharacterized protein n=1 Tax=Microcystis aeruginosa PCC 7806SL TaxID=1903187 RepID=A0AB33BVA3_MICA7|nr:hypothetical protein BH695_2924 [Microcystis aeruginosa PCC 7806SL]
MDELARSRGYNVVKRMTAWTKLITAVPGRKSATRDARDGSAYQGR